MKTHFKGWIRVIQIQTRGGYRKLVKRVIYGAGLIKTLAFVSITLFKTILITLQKTAFESLQQFCKVV